MPFDIYILSFKDILDILLVAFLLYKSYKLMKSSGSINIFIGILVFIIIWVIVSQVLQMRLLGSIFDKLVSVGVIALIVLFQDEIRHFLLSLGSRHRSNSLFRFLKGNKKTDTEKEDIMPIVMACLNMSKGKVGALIVIEKDFPLDDIVRTGDLIDANINQRLIENIFFKNAPLHDGAVVIEGDRIVAAKCILPVTQSDVPKSYGTRHRAAIGMSEISDAIILVVSEETGGISIAHGGTIHRDIAPDQLANLLQRHFGANRQKDRHATMGS